jgi:ATP-dependent helicase HrpB
MVGGSGVRIDPASAVLEHELFVAVDIEAPRPGERAESVVRRATGIEREWLDALGTRTETDVEWDAAAGRAVGFRRVRFGDLVIDERPVPVNDANAVAAALARAAAADPVRALGLHEGVRAGLLARIRFVSRWVPDADMPDIDSTGLAQALPALCAGRRSLADLGRIDLDEIESALLTWSQRQVLNREAPEKLRVPSGSMIRVEYDDVEAPSLSVRIQECFGLAESPRLAGGRVPVTMLLLAPNMRPQQVTRDLRSFWANTYPEVRRELRARYPKHAWPDDPWNAPPQARPTRRPPPS